MATVTPARRSASLLALLGALAPATAAPVSARTGAARTSSAAVRIDRRALARSRDLWATIDLCNPGDHPNMVGVRGSMPGDGHPRDRLYMRFRLQYLEAATKRWVDLASGASPTFVSVGPAASARQDGRSFQLVPAPGRPPATLRGVVDYQWRRGRTVLASLARPTTAGHRSLAGADPASFSAAACVIG